MDIASALIIRGRKIPLSGGLAALSVILFALSTLQAHNAPLGFFGILGGLPITYYAGVGAILLAGVISWLSRSNDRYLMWIETIILLIALRVIPSIDSGNVIASSVQSPWNQYGMAIYILQTGKINTSIFGFFFSNPGSFLVEAALGLVTGANPAQPDFLLNNYEFFIDLAILVCAYFCINRIWDIPVYQSWVALWLFAAGMCVGIESTPDVSLSYIIFLVVLGVILRAKSGWDLVSIALLFAGIAIVNTLASIIVFFLLISFGFWQTRRLIALALLALAGSVLWLALGARPAFSNISSSLAGNYLGLFLSLFSRAFSVRAGFGSEAHELSYSLEVYSALSVIVISALVLLYSVKRERKIVMPFKALLLIAIADVVFFLLTSGVYHAELPIRFYVFLLPAAFFAISELVKYRKLVIVVILLVLVLVPINLIVVSGNYENYLSPSDLATFHYIYNQYPPEANLMSRFYTIQVNYVPHPERTTYLGDQSFLNFSNGTGNVVDFYGNICSGNPFCPGILNGALVNNSRPLLVTLTGYDRNSYSWDNQDSFLIGFAANLSSARNFDLVYANPLASVYLSESYAVS